MPTRRAAVLKLLLATTAAIALLLVGTAALLNLSETGDGAAQRAAFQQLLDDANPDAEDPANALPEILEIAAHVDTLRIAINEQAVQDNLSAFADLAELRTPTTDENFLEEANANAALARQLLQQLSDDTTLTRLDNALKADTIAPDIDLPALLYEADLSYINPLRSLNNLQTARAAEALNAATPDPDTALDHIEGAITIAAVSGRTPVLIEQLIAAAGYTATLTTWRRHTTAANTTPASLQRANQLFSEQSLVSDMKTALEGERLFVAQYVDLTHDKSSGRLVPSAQQRIAEDMGAVLPIPDLSSTLDFIGIAFASRDETLAIIDNYFDEITRAIAADTAAERQRILATLERDTFQRNWRHRITEFMLPAISSATNTPINTERERRLTLLHNAALLHEHNTGQPPASTQELTRNNLIDPALLTDPTTDTRFTLQSLANDDESR